MSATRASALALFLLLPALAAAQIDRIVIPAGTPEDKDLNAINSEQDAQKKLSLFQDFLQKYASNPAAVAYANWQLSDYYRSAGDPQKALEYAEKARALSPHNLDILTSEVTLAQQLKDNRQVFQYSIAGGEAYDSIDKQPKPDNVSPEQLASTIAAEKDANRNAYQFFENAAFNVIAAENDAKTRMDDVEKFTATFPDSKMQNEVNSYALVALSELKDTQRLMAYADKILKQKPDDLPALLTLANYYVDSPEPGALAKAISYAQHAVLAAKSEDPAADKSRKVSSGVAHGVLGRAYAKQGKTPTSISELKSAVTLLKGQDDQQYAIAAYYLGWDYAKLNRLTEARAILTDASSISGPVQQPTRELLSKVNTARAAGK